MGYYLNSIYSCNPNGGLGILGARLSQPYKHRPSARIRLYALYFRHCIILASFIINCDQALDIDLIHEWIAAAME